MQSTRLLDQVRERLQQAVREGASRQDLEALVLELAALADRSAYDLRNLLRSGAVLPLIYDFNKDGKVNSTDARAMSVLCTYPRCAVK